MKGSIILVTLIGLVLFVLGMWGLTTITQATNPTQWDLSLTSAIIGGIMGFFGSFAMQLNL
jgi:hypothetical protein